MGDRLWVLGAGFDQTPEHLPDDNGLFAQVPKFLFIQLIDPVCNV